MKKLIILMSTLSVFYSCSTGSEQAKKTVSTRTLSDYYSSAMVNARKFEASGFNDRKSYQRAIDDFEEVLFIEKLNADAWYNLGRTLFYGGDISRAKDNFKNAIRYRKNFVEAYSMLLRALMSEHQIDQAVDVAEKEYENVPDSKIAMNDLAMVYVRVKRYDEAKSICETIIKNDTKFTSAYITLGDIYYIQKKYELARLVYLKAVDQGDDSGELYTNMGLVAMYTEDMDSALNYLKKGVDKSPGNPSTHLNLGNFFMYSGDYEGAIVEFDTALRFSPMMVEAKVGKGAAYMQLKLIDKAEKLYKEALSIDPDCAEVYFNYGILLADYRGDKSQAINYFNKFLELKDGDVPKDHRVYKYINEIKAERIKPKRAGSRT